MKKNPRPIPSGDRWVIGVFNPYTDYYWTGGGVKPGVKMWSGMKPKEFPSLEAAESEVPVVIEHVRKYKTELEKYLVI